MGKKINIIILIVLFVTAGFIIYKDVEDTKNPSATSVMKINYTKPLTSNELRIIEEMLKSAKDMKEESYNGENTTVEKRKIEVVEEFSELSNKWKVLLPSTNIDAIDKQKINNEIKNIESVIYAKDINQEKLIEYTDIVIRSLTNLTVKE